MGKKKTNNERKNNIFPVTPTSDWQDPSVPRGGKKRKVYTSGTAYQRESGRYSTPGLSAQDSASSHGKKKTPNVGAWNRATVKRGEPVPGASRGVGQETIDGFIAGLEKRKKGKGARR